MKDVYRDVSHWRRLLPRERDVVTGHRAGFRDDKREDDQQDRSDQSQQSHGSGDGGASHGLLGAGVSVGTAALVTAAVVVALGAGGLGVRALVSDDGDSPPAASATTGTSGAPGGAPGGVSPGTSGTASGVAGVPVPAQSEPPATAIQLEYAGGSVVRHECSDASGKGGCAYFDPPGPISVYCTADGCTAYSFGSGSIDGPLSLRGQTAAETKGCQQTSWTIDLTPVGVAETQGLRHPARIAGTITQSRPAEVLPDGTSCLGAEDEYRYDASPS